MKAQLKISQKNIIIDIAQRKGSKVDELIQHCINRGFTQYIVGETIETKFKTYPTFKISRYYPIQHADINSRTSIPIFLGINDFQDLKEKITPIVNAFESPSFQWGIVVEILSQHDVKLTSKLLELNPTWIICRTPDWTIIPLENLIAEMQNHATLLYADIGDKLTLIPMLFSTLQTGVDGIVFSPSHIEEIDELSHNFRRSLNIEFHQAVIKEITDIPHAERVCVDTSSLLKPGEGMMVGNTAKGFGFVHAEVFESNFVASRPFRVNAGDVSEYIAVPGKISNLGSKKRENTSKKTSLPLRTKYLSELRAGDEVYVVNLQGNVRIVSIGRLKIETRPMRMLKLELITTDPTEKPLSPIIITVQYAETVRLVCWNDKIVPITELKIGDELKVILGPGATHFGTPIAENIVEK